MSSQENKNDYLKKVLSNLEKIETASFRTHAEYSFPGDPMKRSSSTYVEEYTNPEDSILGVSWVKYTDDSVRRIRSCYDGQVFISFYHDKQEVVVDDFTFRKLPFRPINPPFFNYAKDIIQYVFTTSDSISIDIKDCEEDYLFKLVINEDEQVEFFGAGHHMPKPPFDLVSDPTSIYEIWIRKSNDLPYKVRREMSHSISSETCSDVQFNSLDTKAIDAMDYIPEGYEVREYGKKYDINLKPDLTGKKAPDWTLMDSNEQMVSLADLKSKVVLIEFTGIGCGPCVASIPFLNELESNYNAEDLTVIAIETWNRKTKSLENYVNKNKINYTFLSANDEVVNNYQTGLAAPSFFILDENRKIKKIIKGYNKDSVGKEITGLINELLK